MSWWLTLLKCTMELNRRWYHVLFAFDLLICLFTSFFENFELRHHMILLIILLILSFFPFFLATTTRPNNNDNIKDGNSSLIWAHSRTTMRNDNDRTTDNNEQEMDHNEEMARMDNKENKRWGRMATMRSPLIHTQARCHRQRRPQVKRAFFFGLLFLFHIFLSFYSTKRTAKAHLTVHRWWQWRVKCVFFKLLSYFFFVVCWILILGPLSSSTTTAGKTYIFF